MDSDSRTIRHRLALALDPRLRTLPGLSRTNMVVIVLILASLVFAILETEPTLYAGNEWLFQAVAWTFVAIFAVEYVLRVWTSVENPDYPSRWRYMLTFHSLIDLVTLVAIALSVFGASGFLLRLARILRVLRIARLGRFSRAFHVLTDAIQSRGYELAISIAVALMLILVSSALLYVVEANHQPDVFGSIPRAMWWSVATLTTVGYGDVYPITVLGQVFAGITAFAGIGLIAMPTGILAAAMSDAIQHAREEDKTFRQRVSSRRDSDTSR